MVAAAAAPPGATGILPGKGATVTIFGRKVSWDAILIAGAGVLGVIFLYRAGQPGSSIGSALPLGIDPGAGIPGGIPTAPTDPGSSTLPGGFPSTTPPYAGPQGGPPGPSGPGPLPNPSPPTSGGPGVGFDQGSYYAPPVNYSAQNAQDWFSFLFGPTLPSASVYQAVPAQGPPSGGPGIGPTQGGYVAPAGASSYTPPAPSAPGMGGPGTGPTQGGYVPPTPPAGTAPGLPGLGAPGSGFTQ